MSRWVWQLVGFDAEDQSYRTALQRKYPMHRFQFGEIRSNLETGLPEPPWTVALITDTTVAATTNDLEIVRFPSSDLARAINGFTAAQIEAFYAPMLSAGVDLDWVAGTTTLRQLLTWLGRQINPAFDPANYTI